VLDARHHPDRHYPTSYARGRGLSLICGTCGVDVRDWEREMAARLLHTLQTDLRGFIRLSVLAAWTWRGTSSPPFLPDVLLDADGSTWRLVDHDVTDRKVAVEETLNEWLWPRERRRNPRKVEEERRMVNARVTEEDGAAAALVARLQEVLQGVL
jgi:hypothetical protein